MPVQTSLISGTQAHKHSSPSSDGGFLDDNITGVTGTSTGSLVYADASSVLQNLSIGGGGTVLTSSGGLPSWQPPGGGVTEFVEEFTLGSDSQTWTATLASSIDLTAYDAIINFQVGSIDNAARIGISLPPENASTWFCTCIVKSGVSTVSGIYEGNKSNAYISGDRDVNVGSDFCGQFTVSNGDSSSINRSPCFFQSWINNQDYMSGVFWSDKGSPLDSITGIKLWHVDTLDNPVDNLQADSRIVVWKRSRT